MLSTSIYVDSMLLGSAVWDVCDGGRDGFAKQEIEFWYCLYSLIIFFCQKTLHGKTVVFLFQGKIVNFCPIPLAVSGEIFGLFNLGLTRRNAILLSRHLSSFWSP